MNAELKRRALTVFEEACRLPRAERSAFLDHACADDHTLRREVEALLEHDLGPSADSDEPTISIPAAPTTTVMPVKHHEEGPPTIPDYDLLRRIGRGGVGEVWLGRNRLDRQHCAIKLLPASAITELNGLREYKRRIAEHPHLVPIEHVGEVTDWLYYIMPLADDASAPGPLLDVDSYEPLTLAVAVERRGPLPIDEVLDIGGQILAALQYLHERGARHGDVKPANIIHRQGRWQLADHGLVSSLHDDVAGHTPGYCPPERPDADEADLYAMGVTLFVIATDAPPEEVKSLLAGERTLPGSDPRIPKLAQVICRACAPDPSDGFPRPADMRAALAGIGDSIQPSRARRLALAVVAVVVLLMVAIAVLVGPWRSDRPAMPPDEGAGATIDGLLTIETFIATRYAPVPGGLADEVKRVGELGGSGGTVLKEREGISVEARLSAPAYCLLFAMPADGSGPFPCVPEEALVEPAQATQLVYPGEGEMWRLTEGAGLHAFVLIASATPLPPLAELADQLHIANWKDGADLASIDAPPDLAPLFFDGIRSTRLVTTARGPERVRIVDEPPAFRELTARLREMADDRAVSVIAVPVLPRAAEEPTKTDT